ncbi:hypothetical protein EDB85DRAFT_2151490 [Lactarius pseudohatsudake]|nr:hypothetical protein EDB85DRAFT_2151490 [Lactarius pseudohatsudake]
MRTYRRRPQVDENGRRKRHSDTQPAAQKRVAPRRSLPQPLPSTPTPSTPARYDSEVPPENEQRRDDGFSERNSESEGESDDPMSALVDPEYWKKKGLILGRCVEMWDTFSEIIDEGVSRDPGVDESFMRTDFENLQYGKFLLLIEVSPAVIKILKRAGERAGPELSLKLDKAIDLGRKQARRVDINGIRGTIGQWPCIDWQPGFPAGKHLLGFHHPTSGRLLCPVTLDWADDKVREDLCRSTQDVGAADYPAFLWPQDIFTRSDFFKGFLRGPVLLAAYRYIFISPSAAKETDRSTRGGNLSLHGVTFVTYESVAYAATVTRFALSNEPTFTAGGRGNARRQRAGFPYRQFYRELLEHKGLMTEDELVDLLQYWNETILSRITYASDDVRNNSAGAIMREQAREKKRLACGSAANAVTPAGLESGLPEPDSAST